MKAKRFAKKKKKKKLDPKKEEAARQAQFEDFKKGNVIDEEDVVDFW